MKRIGILTKETVAVPKGRPSVVVSPNPTRTSVWVDADGNEIDRRTRRPIGKVDPK